MDTMSISTDPVLINAKLPCTLIESPSVSTFMAEEEASICPLLSSNTNGTTTPLAFSHPLTPCKDLTDNNNSILTNICNDDMKADETSSSTGSSSGLDMTASKGATTALFNKRSYKHVQKSNTVIQDSNGHSLGVNLCSSKETPSFVSWNWPLIRKCTFFVIISSLLGMCAIVVAMLLTLPTTCNPQMAWYHGSAFYEVFPAKFADSNNDGVGDIRGIENHLEYLVALGIRAVRLNSIFNSSSYPDEFENVNSLIKISNVVGNEDDLLHLIQSLHLRNISLILDIPLYPYLKEYSEFKNFNNFMASNLNSSDFHMGSFAYSKPYTALSNVVTEALKYWVQRNVDGFYIKGLEYFNNFNMLQSHLAEWKTILGSNRIIIINEAVIGALAPTERELVLNHIDLVDVYFNVSSGTTALEAYLNSILSSKIRPSENGAWIHWSISGAGKARLTLNENESNFTLARTLMQFILPGTISIFYGDEISLMTICNSEPKYNTTERWQHLSIMQWPASNSTWRQFSELQTASWLPNVCNWNGRNLQIVSDMIALRKCSPSIYKNAIAKPEMILPNTIIRHSHDDILIIERVYPRRHSFVVISNFGRKTITMDLSSIYYRGQIMLPVPNNEKIYFDEFKIRPLETIVIKLDK